MQPVIVTTEVPYPREQVYDFLDVMANHEAFTNHILLDWEYSGPERGVGSRARVKTKLAGRTLAEDLAARIGAGEQRPVGAGLTQRRAAGTGPAGP
jgi:hypothetical protein